MKTSFTTVLKADLGEGAYVKYKALSRNIQLKLKEASTDEAGYLDNFVSLLDEMLVEVKGIEVDGKPINMKKKGDWPQELIIGLVNTIFKGTSDEAAGSDAEVGEAEKN